MKGCSVTALTASIVKYVRLSLHRMTREPALGGKLMAPKNPKDKEQIGRVGEAGLFLVSDRTLSWEGESLPRRDPKPAFERLGSIRSSNTSAKRRPEAKK